MANGACDQRRSGVTVAPPPDRNLVDPQAGSGCEHQDLDVEQVPVEPLAREQIPRRDTPEELEPTLRIPDVIEAHDPVHRPSEHR